MKIAFVSDAIYPYNKGGKEKRLYDITTRLAQRGHDVHIYCMKWWKGKENHRVENGVHLHAISPLYPLYSGDRRSIKQGILFGLACLKLIKENWDVIDVDHMPFFPVIFTKLVCLLKGKKMIASWHEVWGRKYWLDYLGWKGIPAFLIEQISFFMPDKIISISEMTTRRLKYYTNNKKTVITVPIGVDYERIRNVKPSHEKSDIIFAGRLLKNKNVDVLLQSVTLLKKLKTDIKCVIIGNGPEEENLHKLTEILHLQSNILFKQFVPTDEELFALMKSSKVFVLPSNREGFGLTTIEANACGIHVITAQHKDNAAQDLVKEFGYICQVNAEKLANMINKIITEEHRVKIMNKYSWPAIIDTLEKQYLQ